MNKVNTKDILFRVIFKILKEALNSGVKMKKEEIKGRRAFLRRNCRLRKQMRN
jgi:hypothetical protein